MKHNEARKKNRDFTLSEKLTLALCATCVMMSIAAIPFLLKT